MEFVLGDVQTLRFADASLDQVLLLNLLTYATEPAQALAEPARALRPFINPGLHHAGGP